MRVSGPANPQGVAGVLRYCATPRNLRRTISIALLVGVLLTAINQGSVILAGHVDTMTWIRCGLNFLIPFLVSNAGLLSGRHPA